ncbi:MAG: hypothetical protein U0163_10055 [Gemmatimonadaceae bacterium]
MRSLAAAGDLAGAVEAARVHEALVRTDLEAPLDPAIAAYVRELKSTTPASSSAAVLPPPITAPEAPDVVREAPSSPGVRVQASGPRMVRWRTAAAYVLGLGSLAALGTVYNAKSDTRHPRKWVLISDTQNATGDEALDRTMPVALAAAIAQSKGLYAVPPDRVRDVLQRMRRPGADTALTPELAREIAIREGVPAVLVPVAERSGDGFELSVKIVDPQTGGVTGMPVTRAPDRCRGYRCPGQACPEAASNAR